MESQPPPPQDHQVQEVQTDDMLFSSSDWNQAMLFQEQRDHLLTSPPSWNNSFTPPASPPAGSSSSCKFPAGLAQKIGYLQMVIQMLTNNNNNNINNTSSGSVHHEQIGQLVDQLLVTARGMFLEQQQQQQPSSFPMESTVYQPKFQAEQGHIHPSVHASLLPKSEPWTEISPHDISNLNFQSAVFGPGFPAEVDEEDGLDPAAGGALLPRDSYELIELDAMEILAEHTHFCEICGKGFKRDANLRMHMRGHGDEYKTPAALARPKVVAQPESVTSEIAKKGESYTKRYSCPYVGCKRNRHHKKFVPLKTVLCVKNHYRRSHCPKLLMCTRCRVKRFSVLADLKTHEKHCGREKWQCSCGTTFSRKDKLLGHIALFVGHRPMMMVVAQSLPVVTPAVQPPVILPSSSSSNGSFQPVFGSLEQCLGYSTSPNTITSGVGGGGGNTTLEVDVAASSCWSPESMFAAGGMGSVGQESNTSCSGGENNINNNNNNNSNGALGFLGLEFFDCKG